MASVDSAISVLYSNFYIVISKLEADLDCVIVYYQLTHPLVTMCHFACANS